ncbi:MAG: hypothetical protein HKN03_09005 [Acidimicrobiales bacterium]|nr:hypothetical protein [Acidimicrobiales bacterium]
MAGNVGGTSCVVPRRRWLLIPSMLLGPESWAGVSSVLRTLRQDPFVAAPRPLPREVEDFVTPWLEDVLGAIPPPASPQECLEQPAPELVIAGHSSACPRLLLVAEAAIARGHHVTTVLLVNGRVPEDGLSATDLDPPLGRLLDNLTRPDDHVPPWHRWWGSLMEDMLPNALDRERVFGEARPIPRALFDQKIPAPRLPDDVRLAFLAMGDMYAPSMDEARQQGWSVARMEGEHLHQVVNPVAVACTMMALVSQAHG